MRKSNGTSNCKIEMLEPIECAQVTRVHKCNKPSNSNQSMTQEKVTSFLTYQIFRSNAQI